MTTNWNNSVLLLVLIGTVSCLLQARAAGEDQDGAEKTSNGPSSGAGPLSDAETTADEVVEPGKETSPEKTSTTATPTTGGPPLSGFTLYNGSSICFRAKLEAQLLVTYYTEGITTTKILTTPLDLPKTARVDGSCGLQSTIVNLVWEDGNYTLSLGFTQKYTKRESSAVTISTWFSNSINFTLDTKNNPAFPNIKNPMVYTAQSNADVRFEAPTNFSYSCTTQEDITLYVMQNATTRDQTVIESIDLSVWDVKIQAFEVSQSGEFGETASCKPDIDKSIPRQNIVPLAVAACLAGIIVLIVIVYFFVKNRTTQYSAME